MAKQGVAITIADLNLEGAEETVRQIEAIGGEGLAVQCDVTKKEEIKRSGDEARRKFGNVTILVNNAGIQFPGTIEESTENKAELTY